MTAFNIAPKDLGRYEKALGRALAKGKILGVMKKAANKVVAKLRTNTKSVWYRGEYAMGWYAEPTSDGLKVGNIAPHWWLVEFGRRPGKRMPPHKPIEAWATHHGISRRAVYPIRRLIARRGIAARKYIALTETNVWIETTINKAIADYVDSAIAGKGP